MPYEKRVTAVTVCRQGDPLFSEMSTRVEIVDEAAGEFVEVSQSGRTSENAKICIAADEWPVLRDAIAELLANCRDHD